jgi:hypothetical protein
MGCGSADQIDGAAEEPIASMGQPWGEATCGTAAADITFGAGSGTVSATSWNATYDHAECRYTFVAARALTVPAGYFTQAHAGYAGPQLYHNQPYPCNVMWAQMSLWKLNGAVYQKVADGGIKYGYPNHFGAPPAPNGTPCTMNSSFVGAGNGTYKLVAQAGTIFTYQPVGVAFVQQQIVE